LRPADEVDYGGKYVEDYEHGLGKFHEIFGQKNFLASVLGYLDGSLSDTMHKFESVLRPLNWGLPNLWSGISKNNAISLRQLNLVKTREFWMFPDNEVQFR